MTDRKRAYIVELVRPRGVTDTQMCYFIQNAVQAEPGVLSPCNPLHDLDRRTVKVKSAARVAAVKRRITRRK